MSAATTKDQRSIEELVAAHKSGHALDQRFYVDPEIYDREIERIVNNSWIMAGHTSQLPERGDFRVLNVGREAAIVVRGEDGTLNGFANVCRHRGSIVCTEAHGHADKFVCPYHGWTYSVDGDLVAARSMGDDFDKTAYSLKPVSVCEIYGLIFVCFSDDPPSIDRALSELREPMGMYDFESLKVVAQRSYPIPANWKLAVENYQECYHCATAHPEYAKLHTMMLDHRQRERASKHMYERMDAAGIKDIEIDFTALNTPPGELGFSYWRTAMFSKYKTGSEDGEAVAPLLGDIKDYDGGHGDLSFGAFTYLLPYNDHVVAYVFTPIDQVNTNCEVYWMVRSDAEEGKDYDLEKLVWLWDVTTKADKRIIVDNSKGVNSKYYEPGPFSAMEDWASNFVDWIVSKHA